MASLTDKQSREFKELFQNAAKAAKIIAGNDALHLIPRTVIKFGKPKMVMPATPTTGPEKRVTDVFLRISTLTKKRGTQFENEVAALRSELDSIVTEAGKDAFIWVQ